MSVKMEDYGKMVDGMREVFSTGRTKTKEWRISQLESIIRCLTDKRLQICNALNLDLCKDEYDSMTDEIGFCLNEARWFIDNLNRLMKDRKKKVDMLNVGGTAYVHCEPLGVVLDIGAWNYPVQVPVSTMINIVAAGNCVVVKPSEVSQHTAQLLADILPSYMDNECIKVILGAVPETTALLKVRWDHVMYTGSGNVGKIIYKAAAEHLTPCTMELGGKCPSYVSAGSDLEAVCNRICWTKFKNAGQTCISVDYVMVQSSIQEAFLTQMAKSIREQYTDNPAECEGYCRIVNDRHFQRVTDLLDGSPGKQVKIGGDTDRETRYIAPTVLTGINPGDRMMQDEIFGPLLPVFAVRDHKEAIDFIKARDKPLHVNVFSKDQAIIDEFISRTSSGGFSANDCLVFRVERGLPFGGIGPSGFGCYGGDAGFDNFSHMKSVLLKSQGMEFLFKMMRYSPHTPEKMKRLQLVQELPIKIGKVMKRIAMLLPVAILLGVALYFGLNKQADGVPKPEL